MFCIRFICAYYSVKYAIGISVTTVVHGIKMQGMKNQHSGTTTRVWTLVTMQVNKIPHRLCRTSIQVSNNIPNAVRLGTFQTSFRK